MESWQRKYLKTNRLGLEKETICDDQLLQQLISDGVLADVDLEDVRCISAPSEKASSLYSIMETRKNGYVAMVKALAGCNQACAHQILLQGYAYCLSRNTPVNFLGETKLLSEYFDDAEIMEIIEDARLNLSEKQLNKTCEYPESTADVITLVSNMEPPLPSLYIPRKLFKRIVINKRLFQAKSSDTYVFKGFQTLSQLEKLVHPEQCVLSSSYLAQDTLTTRFILLENANHWERILNIVNVPTHRVKYEEEANTYVLEMTTGGSKIITRHLQKPETVEDKTALKFLSEDEFIDGILNDAETSSGVCICDSPGMGKTFLLAKLACKIKERCPDGLVAFISLPHFIENLTGDGIPPQQVDREYARVAVLEYLSTSPLSFSILDRLLKKFNVPVHLHLDGFDEVNFKYIEFAIKLLRELVANLPNARVIVTSRPILRYELEAALGVIAFDIAEFTEANQIEFLVNYWEDKSQEFNSHRLAEFAGYCLESLVGRFTKEEATITGIPLLCRLLAEVYSRKAKRFARSSLDTLKDIEDTCQFETSLPNLYANYVEGSLDKLSRKSKSIADIKQFHNWIALKTAFPEFEYRTEFTANINQSIVGSSISMGLLERRLSGKGETVQFIHRTFAEYFVSEFIGKTLRDLQKPDSCSDEFKNKFVRFLLEMVLATKDIGNSNDVEGNVFTNSVVVYFLNYFTEATYSQLTPQIFANQFPIFVSPIRLYSMLFGCLRDNHENVFQFIKIIFSAVDTVALKHFKSEMVPDGDTQLVVWLINVASVSSSLTLLDALFAMFRDCFSYDLQAVCSGIPLHLDTPLHFAIEKADVEKIQYFAKIMSLKDRKLLLSLVIRSNNDPPQIVKRKAEMCKLLLSMDKDLLQEETYTLYDSVHVEILKILIEAGVDPYATKSGQTVLHFGAKYMSSSDFHELCRFFIVDHKAGHLFISNKLFWRNLFLNTIRLGKVPQANLNDVRTQMINSTSLDQLNTIHRQCVANHSSENVTELNEPKWKSPLPFILCRQIPVKVQTLEMILTVPDIDVDERDEHENTLFLLAVKEGYDQEFILVLTQNGANINARNNKGQNALHLATNAANINILPFLINLGVDCKHCDTTNRGNTFLHYVYFERSTADEYHDIISLLSSLEKSDVFHVKNKDDLLPINMAVGNIEVKRETLEILKSHNVDFNSVDNDNNSLLMYASNGSRSLQLMATLIEFGADVMLQNCDGNNFAHNISKYYSAEKYHELIDFLISNGYEDAFRVRNNFGRTPLHWAFLHVDLLPETLELIDTKLVKCNKVNVNVTDKTNRSLLMSAAEGRRSLHVLKALINMGADPMIQDEDGRTIVHFIALFYSAEEFHEIVELLIESGYEQVFQGNDNDEWTFLHWAVRYLVLLPKTLQLIKVKLVQTGVFNINSRNSDGLSILVTAAMGHAPFVNTIRDTPIPRIDWINQETSSLLHRSIGRYGSVNVPKGNWNAKHLRILVEMGADVLIQDLDGSTLLHLLPYAYSAQEYHNVVEYLIHTGGQEIAFQILDGNGCTPLHIAFRELELLHETLDLFNSELFQTSIVDINSCTTDGDSFLVCAAKGSRSVQCLEYLIKMGVDTGIQNKHGSTIAHVLPTFYTPNEYNQLVALLIEMGQKRTLTIENVDRVSPLSFAVYMLELLPETVDLFAAVFMSPNNEILDAPTDAAYNSGFNAVTKDEDSVLHSALLGKRSLELVKYLVSLWADWSVKNKHNSSLAHISASLGLVEHLKYFVELGCDVNALDNDGDNVLQCVVHDASENVYEMVTFLLRKGADKHNRDNAARTAYEYAVEKGITDQRILDALT